MALRTAVSPALAGVASIALLIAGLGATPGLADEPETEQTVDVVYSSSDMSTTLTQQDDLAVEPLSSSGGTTIGIDPTTKGQTLDGIGGSLESSSVYNIAALTEENRNNVMNSLFSTTDGNGYDLMRLSFGCPDFCAEPFYTYDDVPAGETDEDLSEFSIQKDIDGQIISVARQAMSINPDVEFFASAWSPPAWMKDNQSLNNGGTVLPQYYPVLAQYYRLAIEAYADQGILIKALTVANEPTVVPDYPSSAWTWEQERDFIPFLRAELDAGGLDTEIWIMDDNWFNTPNFTKILDDPTAGPLVDGVAVHDYDDGDVTQARAITEQYPDVTVRLTERSYYDVKGMDRVVQLLRNNVSSWTYWLTFLDEDGLPNEGPLDGDSFPQQIGAPHDDLDAYYLDRDYYLYAQFSRYLDRRAVRINSDYGSTSTVTDVVFRNPDGTYVAIVVNQTDYDQPFRLVSFDGQIEDTLPAATVGTYTWTPEAEPLDRAGWSATANVREGEANLMLDGNEDTAWRNFTAQAPGQQVTLDLGQEQLIDQLTLDQGAFEGGASANDWPRGFEVRYSSDGQSWSDPIATGKGSKRLTNISFDTVRARYFLITATKAAPTSYWSIAEIFAFEGEATAPVLTPRTQPGTSDGKSGWFVTAPTATVDVEDGTDPAAIEYSLNSGTWTEHTGPFAVTGDGVHTIDYRALSGETTVAEAAQVVKVDTTAPTSPTAAVSGDRRLTLKARDTGSGIARIQYRIAGGGWKTYSKPVSLSASKVSLQARAIDVAGNTSTVSTKAIAAGTLTKTPKPTVSGTAQAGKSLKAKAGTWNSGVKLNYQWYRGGTKIGKATGRTYTVKAKDVGARLSVTVTGSKSGFATVTKASASTKKVVPSTHR